MVFGTVRRLLSVAFLVSTFLISNVAVADSAAAQQFFDNGNAAFRQGNYEAALANFSDAMANGKDTSRLFYNMGLAHYHLGQYFQAKHALHEASKDGEVAALSYYLLGVIAQNDGNSREAADWFTQARNMAHSNRLRRMSENALTVVRPPPPEPAQPAFESAFSIGYGYDSNAFRSPDTPYIDLSEDIPALVVPVPQSSGYVPIRIKAEYSSPGSGPTTLVASYRFGGDFHTDTLLQTANETNHRVTLGGERKIGSSGSANRRIALAAVFGLHTETNFDRDDGLDRFDDGESIADRFNYRNVGVEADLKNRIGRARIGLNGGWEMRDYDDVPTASSYDMTMYWIGGDIKFPISAGSRLKFGYQYYARDYDERRSKDSTGDASNATPNINYRYSVFEAGVRSRFSERFVTELIYYYTMRSDEFVGYNDYTKSKIRLKSTFDLTDRLHASIRVTYRDQQYSNAFAFDVPGQPSKEYQEIEVEATAEYQFTDYFSLRADVGQEVVESSDPRGEYDRTRAAIGVKWGF